MQLCLASCSWCHNASYIPAPCIFLPFLFLEFAPYTMVDSHLKLWDRKLMPKIVEKIIFRGRIALQWRYEVVPFLWALDRSIHTLPPLSKGKMGFHILGIAAFLLPPPPFPLFGNLILLPAIKILGPCFPVHADILHKCQWFLPFLIISTYDKKNYNFTSSKHDLWLAFHLKCISQWSLSAPTWKWKSTAWLLCCLLVL